MLGECYAPHLIMHSESRLMTPRTFLIVALFALVAPAQQTTEAPATQDLRTRTLRLATWNLYNLFDHVDEPDRPDEGTPPKNRFDMAETARMISALDADVLGVEEVENRRVLEALNRELSQPYPYVELLEGNDYRGIDVGILSRFPIVAACSHRLRPLDSMHRFARDFPVFRIRLAEGEEIAVSVVHFKSKRGKKKVSDAWRRAEAEGARRVLGELHEREPELPMVVMGDFNDTRDARTLAPLMTWLKDQTAKIPTEERVTFPRGKRGEQIDFILTTAGWESKKAGIVADPASPSDHRPVWADFPVDFDLVRPTVPMAVRAVDPPPVPTMDAHDLKGLRARLLRNVKLVGTVTAIHRSRSGRSATLNFDVDYRKAAVAYVPALAMKRFMNLDALVGKKVVIESPVSLYKGQPQVMLTRPRQLRILP